MKKASTYSENKAGKVEHEQPQEKFLEGELVITETVIIRYREVKGDLFSSSDSLAQCISADFKMSSGLSRSFKLKFSAQYRDDISKQPVPVWVKSLLPGNRGFPNDLLTKERYYQKPTYTSPL